MIQKQLSIIIILYFCSILVFTVYVPEDTTVIAQQILVVDAPSSVLEGEIFNVTITAGGSPVIVASVTFDGVSHITGVFGNVRFTAPQVDTDGAYVIVANKTGYMNGTSTILVRNIPPAQQPQLQIQAPAQVIETGSFQVTVTSDTIAVAGVTVSFRGQFYTTDLDGKVQLIAPSAPNDTLYIIIANKIGYRNGETWILVTHNETPAEPLLVIHSPDQVISTQHFTITLTANDLPVEGVTVTFNGELWSTDASGEISLTAPVVLENTVFPILATKPGYHAASKNIQITPQIIVNGWVYGYVTNPSEQPVAFANICLIFYQSETMTVSECILTSQDGFYQLEAAPGNYTLSASKDAYVPSIIDPIVVQSNTSIEINFILSPRAPSTEPIQSSKQPMDYTIDYGIQNQIVGGVITLPEKNQTHISIFNKGIDISVLPSDQQGILRFTITGQDNLSGTVVSIQISDNSSYFNTPLSSIKDFQILYDGVPISPAKTIDEVFASSPQQDAKWIGVFTSTQTYIVMNVPEFSSHTVEIIPIQKVIESLGGPTALFIYLAFIIIGVIVFIGIGAYSDRP